DAGRQRGGDVRRSRRGDRGARRPGARAGADAGWHARRSCPVRVVRANAWCRSGAPAGGCAGKPDGDGIGAMTAFRLGINTCFAVKRWPRPSDWAAVVRDELGLDLVQHCLDLVDTEADRADLEHQAADLRDSCADAGLTLHSTFTGLAAYSANLLLHPDRARRVRARDWYQRIIGFTAAAGALSTGGHIGAYSVADWRNPSRRDELWHDL